MERPTYGRRLSTPTPCRAAHPNHNPILFLASELKPTSISDFSSATTAGKEVRQTDRQTESTQLEAYYNELALCACALPALFCAASLVFCFALLAQLSSFYFLSLLLPLTLTRSLTRSIFLAPVSALTSYCCCSSWT